MDAIAGTYHDGQIQWDDAPDWPDGLRVRIVPYSDEIETVSEQGLQFLEEKYWPDTPENNAEILRRMRAFEPWVMTPEERAQWEADVKLSDQISIADSLKQDFFP